MDPRAGLDGCGKSPPPTGIRSPDRPARSESLYRLSYRGPHKYDQYMVTYIFFIFQFPLQHQRHYARVQVAQLCIFQKA